MNGFKTEIGPEFTPQVRSFAASIIKSAVDEIEAFLNRRKTVSGQTGRYGPREVLANAIGGLLWLRGDLPGLIPCRWICDACGLEQASLFRSLDRRLAGELDWRSQWSRLKRLADRYLAFCDRQPSLIVGRLVPAYKILRKRFNVTDKQIYQFLNRPNVLETVRIGITQFTTEQAVERWIADGGGRDWKLLKVKQEGENG